MKTRSAHSPAIGVGHDLLCDSRVQREQLLGRTLLALREAASELQLPWETVVADDASTDHTADIAREHSARVVAVENRQIAATRNAGARVARGEFLFFIDADTVVTAGRSRLAFRLCSRGPRGADAPSGLMAGCRCTVA